jgi:hypothetical protein
LRLGIEVGKWEEERDEIPTSILHDTNALIRTQHGIGMDILVCLHLEAFVDVLCRYVGKLWNYSMDGFR